jgi:Tfp pilus assembly protein PilP
MPTTKRKDFDDELAAWLEEVRLLQRDDVTELDRLADLWLANEDAKAIRDPRSEAAKAEHEKINAALDSMGL